MESAVKTPVRLDDVMDILGHRMIDANAIPINTVLAFGTKRISAWLRLDPTQNLRGRVRTDVLHILQCSDAPSALYTFLTEEYKTKYHLKTIDDFGYDAGSVGNTSLLNFVVEHEPVSGDLDPETRLIHKYTNMLLGCASADQVECADHVLQLWSRTEFSTYKLVRSLISLANIMSTAVYSGSVRMLEWLHLLYYTSRSLEPADVFLDEEMSKQDAINEWLYSNCPRDMDTIRWLLRRAPWTQMAVSGSVLYNERMDLLRELPDVLWSFANFRDMLTFPKAYGVELLRFAWERMTPTEQGLCRVDAAQWLLWRKSAEGGLLVIESLEFLTRTTPGCVEFSPRVFGRVQDAEELRAVVEMGAPWPTDLNDIGKHVVDAALMMPECPPYHDWFVYVNGEDAFRVCRGRGLPVPPNLFEDMYMYPSFAMNVTKLNLLLAAGVRLTPEVASRFQMPEHRV